MTPPLATGTWLGADPSVLSDDDLLAGAAELGELKRRVDSTLAAFAGEVKRRSRPEDGFAGLAQRTGARTPENLVQQVTGTSKREAGTMVRVGRLLADDADPWLAPVADGLAEGVVSVEKADVIRAGLGSPTADVAADDLLDAATKLAAAAPTVTVENLAALARAARDELDAAHVRDRHAALRDKRSFTMTLLADGTTRYGGIADPESAAVLRGLYDALTSPRRGGPRFVDSESVAAADAVTRDTRTTAQLAHDGFVELVRLGSEVEPGRLLGAARHAVQVLVTERDLRQRTGGAFLRDDDEALPLEVADRHLCDAGVLPILFDDAGATPLAVGREKRLFTSRQRAALAARDGGCRFPGCDRPVSWCEAHHVELWSRGGATDVEVGILLCRHHHMLIHDNGWGIRRDADHGFVAIPPRSRDPEQKPVPMPPRSRVAERLRT